MYLPILIFFLVIVFEVAALIAVFLYYRQNAKQYKIAGGIDLAKIKIQTDKLRVEAMLDSIGDGVVATDKDGVIIFLNKAAEEMLLWKADAVGQNLSTISLLADENGAHVPLAHHPLHRCILRKQKITTKDYHFIRRDKTNLAVYISATPIIIDKKVTGAIEVFRDITKEKNIDKAKSEFVYLASHQLRTPLSTIKWYLELLLSSDAGPINDRQKEYLGEAYNSTHNMVQLVNEILDVSRLELGTLASKHEMVDVTSIVRDCENEAAALINEKKAVFTKKISKQAGSIYSDPRLIRIIFQNLISNAAKYIPEHGKIRVEVVKEGKALRIVVADNGYGIPLEAQPKIFSKLFRADNVKELVPSGTGLGLYTVKSAVDQLGGNISFESAINKGTTFRISLHLRRA